MNLANFLNKIFTQDGFILIDYNSKKYQIGKPVKEKPINLRILDKSLHYKLMFYPDLYLGEAYTDGSLIIENGTLTEFLEIAFKNIGRSEISTYSKILKKLEEPIDTLLIIIKLQNQKKMSVTIMIYLKNSMIFF